MENKVSKAFLVIAVLQYVFTALVLIIGLCISVTPAPTYGVSRATTGPAVWAVCIPIAVALFIDGLLNHAISEVIRLLQGIFDSLK